MMHNIETIRLNLSKGTGDNQLHVMHQSTCSCGLTFTGTLNDVIEWKRLHLAAVQA